MDSVLENLDHNRHMIKELLGSQLPSVRYHIPDNSYLAWLDLEALNLGENPTETLLTKDGLLLMQAIPLENNALNMFA